MLEAFLQILAKPSSGLDLNISRDCVLSEVVKRVGSGIKHLNSYSITFTYVNFGKWFNFFLSSRIFICKMEILQVNSELHKWNVYSTQHNAQHIVSPQ